MKKLISAVTSICMAATMVSSIAPFSVSAADATKTLELRTFGGASATISADAVAAGDVTVPCAMYLIEDTPDTTSFQYGITVSDDSADPSAVVLQDHQPNSVYYSTPQEYTNAAGTTFTTDVNVFFASTVNRKGQYSATGSGYVISTAENQSKFGFDNYYIGGAWTGPTTSSTYTWTGAKSDDYPILYFDVTIKKGSKSGNYTIDFAKYSTSDTQILPSVAVNAAGKKYADMTGYDGLVTKSLTLTVGDAEQPTTTTTAPATTTAPKTTTAPATTTTTKQTPVGDEDIILELGSYSSKDIDKDGYITGAAMLTSDKAIAGFDVQIDFSQLTAAGMEVEVYDTTEALGGKSLVINPDTFKINGATIDGTGAPLTIGNGTFLDYDIYVPSTVKAGTYTYTTKYTTFFKEGASKDSWTCKTIDGTITIGDAPATTTTAPVTTTVPTTTTTKQQPVGDEDVTLELGSYSSADIDKDGYITGAAMLTSDKAIAGFDVQIDFSQLIAAGMEVEVYDTTEAFGGKSLVINPDTFKINGATIDGTGAPLTVGSGTFLDYDIYVPETVKAGTYTYTTIYTTFFKEGASKDSWTCKTIDGTITIGETPATTTTIATTTTSTTTTTTTTTQHDPLTPVYGDTNCDGKVNVADVVLLNKWLNDAKSYDLTEQGALNANCDLTDSALNAADSDAIIRSIVSLVTLPITK